MRTIEEAASEQAYDFVHNDVDYSHPNFVANEKKQSFEDGIAFSEEWIQVEELPEQGCYVIVKFLETGYYGHHWCSANYYQASKTFEVHNKELSNFHITHWRPIELK